jgi:bifunctional non-homologous end joining protein LigD
LAVYAANKLKECLDRFEIASFPKLSGNKGIQVHIPIGTNIFSYEETRRFTSFFANYLAEQHPNEFTIERLKKKRGSRLYIDFLQHAEGKTIISPYSVRGVENGTVAAPLHWNEVNEQLDAESFTMDYCINRVKSGICPMKHYFSIDQHEKIKAIVEHLL